MLQQSIFWRSVAKERTLKKKKKSQIRDKTGKVKRRVSQVSEYVDTISFDGKARARYWRRGKRVETAIGGNKIRAQEISFQGIPTHATFSISGDPRDVRISVVVSHATQAGFPYRRRMCFLQDSVSLMCLPWLLTLIEPRVSSLLRVWNTHLKNIRAPRRLARQLGEYKLRGVQC